MMDGNNVMFEPAPLTHKAEVGVPVVKVVATRHADKIRIHTADFDPVAIVPLIFLLAIGTIAVVRTFELMFNSFLDFVGKKVEELRNKR